MKTNFSFQPCRGFASPSLGKNTLSVATGPYDCLFGKGSYSTRAHCVGCMSILRAHFFVPRPFSKQWSEKLPLSFSAASLTRSPVCLRAICYASTVHPANTRCHDTVPTNLLTLWVVQSSRPHPCFSNRETFKIQKAALPACVCKNTDRSLSYDACWCIWNHTLKGFVVPVN